MNDLFKDDSTLRQLGGRIDVKQDESNGEECDESKAEGSPLAYYNSETNIRNPGATCNFGAHPPPLTSVPEAPLAADHLTMASICSHSSGLHAGSLSDGNSNQVMPSNANSAAFGRPTRKRSTPCQASSNPTLSKGRSTWATKRKRFETKDKNEQDEQPRKKKAVPSSRVFQEPNANETKETEELQQTEYERPNLSERAGKDLPLPDYTKYITQLGYSNIADLNINYISVISRIKQERPLLPISVK